MIHSSLENHLLVFFLQAHLVVVHGLIVITQVHARSSDKFGINQ